MVMQAYDIAMLTRPGIGLPPGIALEQWPLDPNKAFPLMHYPILPRCV